jgi:hypothetical protein
MPSVSRSMSGKEMPSANGKQQNFPPLTEREESFAHRFVEWDKLPPLGCWRRSGFCLCAPLWPCFGISVCL